MRTEITPLNKFNFNDVVVLIMAIMKDNGVSYSRTDAMTYLSSHADNTMVLEVNDTVMGMYAFSENANSYTLNFFALNPFIREKKEGYRLYLDMKNRLTGKPVIAPVHTENKNMIKVVSKRGTFIGRFSTSGGKTIDYYSINFGDKDWTK
jgi:hypothetical protein